ncbi:MAG: type IV pilin-like G/H family protein [Cyanobacteria bacterium P01_F01_bin.150]
MNQSIAPHIVFLSWLFKGKANTVERGFTLIELLVVIVIGGILSAIALPTFLSQANKAKESEARVYVGSVNRAQQTYFMEQTAFSNDIDKLGLGISKTTENYTYATVLDTDSGDDVAYTTATQQPTTKQALRAFSGQAWNGVSGSGLLSFAIVCESKPGGSPPTIASHQCPSP